MTIAPRHWKDIAIDCLGMELAIAKKRINDLEADRDVYREIAREGIESSARLTEQNRRLQDSIRSLRQSYGVAA